jgi:hypothetical protein|tara:strand:- start:32227 stop:32463 length:237 start_codon:yes stop_codon:yes gene_type:complete
MPSVLELELALQEDTELVESIADDVNDTIRLEYRLDGEFTEQEVETLIHQKIANCVNTDEDYYYDRVNELIDYNLIGA